MAFLVLVIDDDEPVKIEDVFVLTLLFRDGEPIGRIVNKLGDDMIIFVPSLTLDKLDCLVFVLVPSVIVFEVEFIVFVIDVEEPVKVKLLLFKTLLFIVASAFKIWVIPDDVNVFLLLTLFNIVDNPDVVLVLFVLPPTIV